MLSGSINRGPQVQGMSACRSLSASWLCAPGLWAGLSLCHPGWQLLSLSGLPVPGWGGALGIVGAKPLWSWLPGSAGAAAL